ncbi:hypothetical protein TRVL_04350 [Trypanosoma vivax]|nr:hypothetical protein TRVL_04350 [Trypanosoma vivax]
MSLILGPMCNSHPGVLLLNVIARICSVHLLSHRAVSACCAFIGSCCQRSCTARAAYLSPFHCPRPLSAGSVSANSLHIPQSPRVRTTFCVVSPCVTPPSAAI